MSGVTERELPEEEHPWTKIQELLKVSTMSLLPPASPVVTSHSFFLL